MEPTFYEAYYRHENDHWWFRWRYDLVKQLVSSLKTGPGYRILDAGCGTGQMTKHLEQLGQAVGMDSAGEAISYAQARGVRRLVRGSITDPPFVDGAFDCVLALDVIEHVDDDIGILSSMVKIVKPGGNLIVTVPAFQALWSEHDEINHHKRRYRAGQLRSLIEEAGFTVDRVTYCNTALCGPVYLTRKAKNLVRSFTGSDVNRPLQSDLGEYPRVVNEGLYRLMKTETRLMRWMDLPFGVSILAVASRPREDGTSVSHPNLDAVIADVEQVPPIRELAGVSVGSSFQGVDQTFG